MGINGLLFPISYAGKLQTVANRYLKNGQDLRGVPIPKFYIGVYRVKKELQSKALAADLNCTQLVKFYIMKYAVKEETQYVYGHMLERQRGKKNSNGVKEL